MSQNQNFGIMDEGYFVPRTEIIAWINDLLKVNLTKIEELGSGAVYCQVLDAIYPGKISMNKVNWKAKNDYEFLNNYKVLQAAFDKFGIKRYIEVEKLSKAKYQDNLQFVQWLKRYFDVNCGERGNSYPAEERRGNIKVDFGFAQKIVVPKSFNAVGQVIPNTRVGSRQKRIETGTSGQKEVPKRLVSPNVDKLPKPRNSSNEKRGSIISTGRTQSKDKNKPPHPQNLTSQHPPTPSTKKSKTQQKQPTSDSHDQSLRPSKTKSQELQKYKKLVRDLETKIEMITEITQGHDDAESKVKLIQEVLSIGNSNCSKNVDQPAASNIKNIQTIKTQQIEQSIHNQSVHQKISHEVKAGEHYDLYSHDSENHSMASKGIEEDEAF